MRRAVHKEGDSGQLLRLCSSAARCGNVPAVTDVHRKREECRTNLHSSVTPQLCAGFLLKPYGEGQMTTEAGRGYCWKPLAMNLHVGGLGVMFALMSTWSDDSSCILPE